jgi:thioredoxin 1
LDAWLGGSRCGFDGRRFDGRTRANRARRHERVLFFAASWCPTCRSADADINGKLKTIPKDVVIYKTDYDTETALKTKYGITRQHTFVYVNAKADAIKKWSGGGLEDILANVKAAK